MSKVYIVQEQLKVQRGRDGEPVRNGEGAPVVVPIYDFTPAAQYGELVTLLPTGDFLMGSVEWEGAVLPKYQQLLYEGLVHYSDEDYLLLVGAPWALAAASVIASNYNDGCVKWLVWDKRAQTYMVTSINDRGDRAC